MEQMDRRVQRMHPADNVVVALVELPANTPVALAGESIVTRTRIPFGHKMALRSISRGTAVIKYGERIGVATADIVAGDHVHSHNLITERGIQRRDTNE
ncbi:MAG: hydrolase [Chloroflexi bacterium]|nr:hydrolase [Chloroflexota bacterium]